MSKRSMAAARCSASPCARKSGTGRARRNTSASICFGVQLRAATAPAQTGLPQPRGFDSKRTSSTRDTSRAACLLRHPWRGVPRLARDHRRGRLRPRRGLGGQLKSQSPVGHVAVALLCFNTQLLSRVMPGEMQGARDLLAHHLLAVHRRLVPIDHGHIVVARIIPDIVTWPDLRDSSVE